MTNIWGPILAALIGAVLVYVRRLHKLVGLFEEYPPHRHINGKILYPKDYQPSKLERLES